MIVIGFGKAGKTLAAKFAMMGKHVALVEKDTSMYGGTCINIGCIPTKTLLVAAEKGMDFSTALSQKDTVVTRLRNKNQLVLENAGVTLVTGVARFTADKEVEVTAGKDKLFLTSDVIVINTGAIPAVLPIPGWWKYWSGVC